MKVLFVCSGNNDFGINPIIKNQGESLKKIGIELNFFTIKGKGFIGYFKNIFILRRFLNKNNFDVIHVHYSLSAYITSLSFVKPLVVSLMGSEVYSSLLSRLFIKFFNKLFWTVTIVKSEEMKKKLDLNNICVIPNGVDLNKFLLIEKSYARRKVGFNEDLKYIVFLAKIERPEKNFELASEVLKNINFENAKLETIFNTNNDLIPFYLNAADVLLLTSLWEGSPNVIKEAMACNCPIVSTDVGDVKWIIGDLEGCYISTFEVNDVAEKIKLALNFSEKIGKTKGRERLIELGLDSDTIANRILKVYKTVLNGS